MTARRSGMCMRAFQLALSLALCCMLVAAPTQARKGGTEGTQTKQEQSAEEDKANGQAEDRGNSSQDNDSDPEDGDAIKTTSLRVIVLEPGTEKLPIDNARVTVTYENASEVERETDKHGVALLEGLPYGSVDLDVTAPGRHSAGKNVKLGEPERTLMFRLKVRSLAE